MLNKKAELDILKRAHAACNLGALLEALNVCISSDLAGAEMGLLN
jgi:hypothetical protein